MAETQSTHKWLGVLAGIIGNLFGLVRPRDAGHHARLARNFFGIFAIIQAIILLIGGIIPAAGRAPARWIDDRRRRRPLILASSRSTTRPGS